MTDDPNPPGMIGPSPSERGLPIASIDTRERKAEGGTVQPRPSTQSVGIPPTLGQDLMLLKELVRAAEGADDLKRMAEQIIALHQRYGSQLNSMIDVVG
jgi:hypothetical protein